LILCAAGALVAGCAVPLGKDFILERNNKGTGLVIGNYDLQVYVPVPVAGAAPVTALSRGDMEIQAVWRDAAGSDISGTLSSFAIGEVYRADITLSVKNGWSFDPGINFQYPGASVAVQPGPDGDLSRRALSTVTYHPAAEAIIIERGDLSSYIPLPALGATPVISFGGAQYTGIVKWKDGDGEDFAGPFQGGVEYTAEVTLAAAPGYVFGLSPVFSHTGALGPDPADLGFTPDPGNSGGELRILFPSTGTGAEITAGALELTHLIPKPFEGAVPVSSFTSPTMQYGGTVTWKKGGGTAMDTPVFEYGETYTARAVLTAASGFVLPPGLTDAALASIHQYDDPANLPVYSPGAGKTAVITITFEPPGRTDVNEYDLAAYIPLPVAGKAPKWAVSDRADVLVTVRWDYYTADGGYTAMSLLELFHCRLHRAEITLQAKTGYQFNQDFFYSSGVEDLVVNEPGPALRRITVVYEEPSGSFAPEAGAVSALERIQAARDEFTHKAAPLYVDLSRGNAPEMVELIDGSLGTDGMVLNLSHGPAHVRIDGQGRKVQLTGSPTGSPVLTVGSGVTLYLRNITLTGIDTNTAPLITVEAGGELVLEDGAVVEKNTNANRGGGILVNNGGSLLMTGGKISGNNANSGDGGGGVYNAGTFTMKAGEISDNFSFLGGGVYVDAGTFTMEGGEISGNSANFGGGGVYNASGITMKAGKISGNLSLLGGGVKNHGIFIMEGGEISGNTTNGGAGGGVAIEAGTFTMKSGKISGNTSFKYSGGVLIQGGTFAMEGGEISGNTANGEGGGVYIDNKDTSAFTKTGGIIYGDSDTTHTPGSTENTSASGQGHAVYLDDAAGKMRNNNVDDNLSASYSSGSWDITGTW
jgi:hypothetical protein